MPRYVAFLRGVSPMNAKMPELKRAFERAGFTQVRTLLSSGNVIFNARAASDVALERRAEAAMKKQLGHAFYTVVRSVGELEKLLAADPFARFGLSANAKRVVTFLRRPTRAKLPPEVDGARMLIVRGREALTAYLPSPRGPVFMQLIEKTFGKDATTRTWDTVRKCTAA